jgi:hypothetical protein
MTSHHMKAFLIGMLAAAVTIAIVFRVQMLRNTVAGIA